MNVIDTLSLAFNRVARHIWLIIIPVLLDLFFWFGPKISVQPVVDQVSAALRQSMAATPGVDLTANQTMSQALDLLQNSVAQTNYMSLLAWGGRLGVPSILAAQPLNWYPTQLIEIQSVGQMFLMWVVLLAAGLLLACLFLGLLAQDVRAEPMSLSKLLGRLPRYWLRMLAMLLPVGAVAMMSISAWAVLGIFAILMVMFVIWLIIYLTFFPQAVTLGEARPMEALWTSFGLVRMNFWATLALLALSFVIESGLALVWQRLLAVSLIGTGAAVLLNAYVGTSLTMALFLFYRDRMIRWHEAVRQRSQAQ